MPELPEMQALAERLAIALQGMVLERVSVLGFTGLKTVRPSPDDLLGLRVVQVGRRGKFLVLTFGAAGSVDRPRVLVHLSQAGRLDLEIPPKSTKPKGSVVRLAFSNESDSGTALLVREFGTQRKAGWWALAPGDEGPLGKLGPEPDDPAFAVEISEGDSTRHLHTVLRDQRFVAGIGRGYADDALNRARLSPFAALRSLSADDRTRLLAAVRSVLTEALERERIRTGCLSDAKLGTRFLAHNRVGEPCPNCGKALLRVSFETHEIVYCKHCQTKGRKLADRRLSRLLR